MLSEHETRLAKVDCNKRQGSMYYAGGVGSKEETRTTHTSATKMAPATEIAAAMAMVMLPLLPLTACSDCPGARRWRAAVTQPA